MVETVEVRMKSNKIKCCCRWCHSALRMAILMGALGGCISLAKALSPQGRDSASEGPLERVVPQQKWSIPRVSVFEATLEQELTFGGSFIFSIQGYEPFEVKYPYPTRARVLRRWKAKLERDERGAFSVTELEEVPMQYEPEYGLEGVFLKKLFSVEGSQPPRLASFQLLEPNNLASALTAWGCFFSSRPSKGITRDNQQKVYSPYAARAYGGGFDFEFTDSEEDWLAALSCMKASLVPKQTVDGAEEIRVTGTMATVKNGKPQIHRNNRGTLELNIRNQMGDFLFKINYRIGMTSGGEVDREETDLVYDPYGEFLREAKITLVCDENDWNKFIVPVKKKGVKYEFEIDQSPSFTIRFHMWPVLSQQTEDEALDEAEVGNSPSDSVETYKLCGFDLGPGRKRFVLMHNTENVALVSEVVKVTSQEGDTTVWENTDSSFRVTRRADTYTLTWPKDEQRKPAIVLEAED